MLVKEAVGDIFCITGIAFGISKCRQERSILFGGFLKVAYPPELDYVNTMFFARLNVRFAIIAWRTSGIFSLVVRKQIKVGNPKFE